MAYRRDIQALRAVAVSAVVAFHFNKKLLPGGYLGVDVFFVISGFLITSIIMQDQAGGTFSLRAFWLKRVRRILPSALAVALATGFVSLFVLSGKGQVFMGQQLLYFLLFGINFLFSGGVNYFSPSLDYSPLLQMWSLSVEEQFYAILPLVLRVLPRRAWPAAVASITLVSLVLCYCRLGLFTPPETFYLLPTRAWQLGMGSMLALAPRLPIPQAALRSLAWPALIALLLVLFFRTEGLDSGRGFSPSPSALVACAAVAVLIAAANRQIECSAVTGWLCPIGDLSYALYLVHWPVLSLYRNAIMSSTVDRRAAILLLIIIVVLSLVLHRWIERPVHRSVTINPRLLGIGLGIASMLVGGVAAASSILGERSALNPLSRGSGYVTLGKSCTSEPPYDAGPGCRTSARPEVMVWGDSMALATVAGLVSSTPKAHLVVASRPICAPLLEQAPTREGIFDTTWALQCMRFNRTVIDKLRHMSSVRTVALIGVYAPYLSPDHDVVLGDGRRISADRERAIRDLVATIRLLRDAGKRVVLLMRPPTADFDVGMCVERLSAGRLILRNGCGFASSGEGDERVLAFLEDVKRAADVDIIRLDAPICPGGKCLPVRDGVSLYHDHGHLSIRGSAWVARKLDLTELLVKQAR